MSQSQRPGSNLITFLLLATTLFLGMQLFMGGMQTRPDTRTAAQILDNLRQMNRQGKDVTIQAEFRAYESKVKEEAKRAGMPEAEVNARILEGSVLVAHTSLRAGVEFNNLGRSSSAFNFFDGRRKAFERNPKWTTLAVKVAPIKGLEATTLTPAEMNKEIVRVLNEQNKRDMIWGFFPGYEAIDRLVAMTGRQPWFSYTFAALLLALVVRAVVWPLAQKQLMFSRQMMQLQPLVEELKKKHTNKAGVVDNIALQQEMMGLYRDYGINLTAGCLPALAQLPLFLLVFNSMLHYRFEFSNGYFAWVNPGSHAQVPWIAPHLGEMDYILLVVYGISMVIATYLQPIGNPQNIKQQRMIGVAVSVLVTVMMPFFPLPSAFVLYWVFLNIFSTTQSLLAYRAPLPPLEKVATAAGGVRARGGFFEKLVAEQEKAMQAKMQQQGKVIEGQTASGKNGKDLNATEPPKGKKKNKPTN